VTFFDSTICFPFSPFQEEREEEEGDSNKERLLSTSNKAGSI